MNTRYLCVCLEKNIIQICALSKAIVSFVTQRPLNDKYCQKYTHLSVLGVHNAPDNPAGNPDGRCEDY